MRNSDVKMTDRERILMNIAAMLAKELCNLQSLPSVREYMNNPHSLSHIRMESGYAPKPKYEKGDLVLCQTSVGRQQNPWLISFVESAGCKNDPSGLLLRSVGEKATCNYGDESCAKIVGIPERLLWEGDKQQFSEKLTKALLKLDTHTHRYRGLRFPKEGQADVTFGEIWGGLRNKTKPYTLRVIYTRKTTIKNIVAQLESQGFGTRKFEAEDGVPTHFMNPQPITRASNVATLGAAEIDVNAISLPSDKEPDDPRDPSERMKDDPYFAAEVFNKVFRKSPSTPSDQEKP